MTEPILHVWQPPRHGGIWYVKFWYQGRQVMRSTRERDEELARVQAQAIYDLETGRTPRPRKPRVWTPKVESGGVTIGDVARRYEARGAQMEGKPGWPSARTRRQNLACLRLVVAVRFPLEKEAIEELPLAVVDGELVRRFVGERQRAAGSARRGAMLDRVMPGNRSINSVIAQAKGVFSRRAVSVYAEAGWTLPAGVWELVYFPLLRVAKG